MHGRVVVEAIAWRDVLASWLVARGLRMASRKTRREISAQLAAEGFGQTTSPIARGVMDAARQWDRAARPVASPAVIRRADLDEPPVVRYPGRGGE
jgi:hypothetical protein